MNCSTLAFIEIADGWHIKIAKVHTLVSCIFRFLFSVRVRQDSAAEGARAGGADHGDPRLGGRTHLGARRCPPPGRRLHRRPRHRGEEGPLPRALPATPSRSLRVRQDVGIYLPGPSITELIMPRPRCMALDITLKKGTEISAHLNSHHRFRERSHSQESLLTDLKTQRLLQTHLRSQVNK